MTPASYSAYPPIAAFIALVVGVALVSIPAALIVAGGLGLTGWLAYFVGAVRKAQ